MNGMITLKQAWYERLVKASPGQLVVQITNRCNAQCPQCSMRISNRFTRHTLDKKEVFRIIRAAGKKRIKAISFTGGEPFLMFDDLCEYIDCANDYKIPFIRTGTNGYFLSKHNSSKFNDKISRTAQRLVKANVRNVWISLDSYVPEVHEQMRGFPGVFEGIRKSIPLFREAGFYPSVNLGINRNLGGRLTWDLRPQDFSSVSEYKKQVYHAWKKAFSLFYEAVIEMGFTIVNACYPMSVDDEKDDLSAVYQASTTDRVVRFSAIEKQMIFRALKHTIPLFRHRIRIFSPLVSVQALEKSYGNNIPSVYPCQGGINYFFIDAVSGDTFPCGYRGMDNYGKFYDLKSTDIPGGVECTKCDWECFRDPSELAGPVFELMSDPVSLALKTVRNPNGIKTWSRDLLYYRACGYFDGRTPPDNERLNRFKKTENIAGPAE